MNRNFSMNQHGGTNGQFTSTISFGWRKVSKVSAKIRLSEV
jgi:hypothetical protein